MDPSSRPSSSRDRDHLDLPPLPASRSASAEALTSPSNANANATLNPSTSANTIRPSSAPSPSPASPASPAAPAFASAAPSLVSQPATDARPGTQASSSTAPRFSQHTQERSVQILHPSEQVPGPSRPVLDPLQSGPETINPQPRPQSRRASAMYGERDPYSIRDRDASAAAYDNGASAPPTRRSTIIADGDRYPEMDGGERTRAKPSRRSTMISQVSSKINLDDIIPHMDREALSHIRDVRVKLLLGAAYVEKRKYQWKAKIHGYALNCAIGLQVLLGTLTTALSVATTGRQTSIMTATLGGAATMVASYLARARGSGEPEASNTKVRDLDQFCRECLSTDLDAHGGDKSIVDRRINDLRVRFEELLGNATADRHTS